jgi:hypothetical protein
MAFDRVCFAIESNPRRQIAELCLNARANQHTLAATNPKREAVLCQRIRLLASELYFLVANKPGCDFGPRKALRAKAINYAAIRHDSNNLLVLTHE